MRQIIRGVSVKETVRTVMVPEILNSVWFVPNKCSILTQDGDKLVGYRLVACPGSWPCGH